MAQRIDGKAIATRLKDRIAEQAAGLRRGGVVPMLAAVLVGDDPSARSYARSQAASAEAAGVAYRLVELPATAESESIAITLDNLSRDADVHGIMLHLPLPAGVDAFALQQRIAPAKDVEGVGPANLGLLAMGRLALAPCTAAAAFECLKSVMPDLVGRNVVVVGRSAIVGKPLAMLLLAAHATVTQCHSRTRDLASHTRRAEALLVAAGAPGLIGAEHVSPGAVVIDVGTNRVTETDSSGVSKSRLAGDVRFAEVEPIAAAITPVPGGVGPVTAAMLVANTVTAAANQSGSALH